MPPTKKYSTGISFKTMFVIFTIVVGGMTYVLYGHWFERPPEPPPLTQAELQALAKACVLALENPQNFPAEFIEKCETTPIR